jgi:hypothetical protein
MKRKTYWDIYLIIRNYKGKNLFTTDELKKFFGYSKRTRLNKRTKIWPFINYAYYKYPHKYWSLMERYVVVSFEDLPDYEKKVISNEYNHVDYSKDVDKEDSIPFFYFLDSEGKPKFVAEEDQIPFWKLAKYGGYIL